MDIWPRCMIPRLAGREGRVDFCVFFSAAFLLGIGFFAAFPGASDSVEPIRRWSADVEEWLVAGIPAFARAHTLCPFCGGTRAFFASCRGDFAVAAQYSLSGLAVFLWMTANLPVRGLLLWRRRRGGGYVRFLAAAADYCDGKARAGIFILLGLWVLQLLLHGLGALSWRPLAESAIAG